MSQIIAIEEVREFLLKNMPNFSDPVLFIFSEYYNGCPNCNSSATIFRVVLIEQNILVKKKLDIIKLTEHNFPFDVFLQIPKKNKPPKKIIIGTRPSGSGLELVVRKII